MFDIRLRCGAECILFFGYAYVLVWLRGTHPQGSLSSFSVKFSPQERELKRPRPICHREAVIFLGKSSPSANPVDRLVMRSIKLLRLV